MDQVAATQVEDNIKIELSAPSAEENVKFELSAPSAEDNEIFSPLAKFEDIQKILSELQEAISMATKRTTLLGKRLRSEVEEEDLKYALVEVERLEKAYITEIEAAVAEGRRVPCWFEFVATHETLNTENG